MQASIPDISVLLSVYNSENYISESIESILDQSYANFELIIVDDCSTDGSFEICKSYANKDRRIVLLRNSVNLGGCQTLNEGLKHTRGKYVARQDNDEWSYPDRLAKQIKFMEDNPEVGVLGGSMEIINEMGEIVGKRNYKTTDSSIRKYIFRYSPFSHPLVMFRKSILDKVGYYDCTHAPADDYELYFRMGQESKFANLNDVLLKYRVVATSLTNSRTRKMELKTIGVRKKYKNTDNYKINVFDKAYNFFHFLSVYLVPAKIKIYLFNVLRNS